MQRVGFQPAGQALREESVSPGEDWFDRLLKPFDPDAEEDRHVQGGGGPQSEVDPEDDEHGRHGIVRPKIRDISTEPTDKEIEEHYMHHSEFRQWCPHCVKGKAVSYSSRRKKDAEDGVPTVSIDYMFMGDQQAREEERGMPMLVTKDKRTKMIWARVVLA